MREAPSRVLMQSLWDAGARVCAYDPVAMGEAARLFPEALASGALVLADRAMSTLDDASALVIVTEWQEFRSPDFEAIKQRLLEPVIFDGRNVYDPGVLRELGFKYFGVGRGDSVAEDFR
jgi:UDPglucose 6-dehydrogenase